MNKIEQLRDLCYPVILGLLFCLTEIASATDYHWTGLANNGLWTSAGNWDQGVPVPNSANNAFLDAANGWSVMSVASGQTIAGPNMIYGPEWGATLNIYGTLKFIWYLAPVQSNPSERSTVNMYDGSSIAGEGIALGDGWWYSGGPYVTMNMYGNAKAGINWMYWGGHLNLYDNSVMSITNGVTLQTTGAVSDATRSIKLAGGKLILPGGFTATVNNWIARGILSAYGITHNTSSFVIDTSDNNYPGRTVVRTTVVNYTFVDLNPSGFSASYGYGISGSQQIGYGLGPTTSNKSHALLWSASSNNVADLNPIGFYQSFGYGIDGGHQVGYGTGHTTVDYDHDYDHALLWSGTSNSAVDLNPNGFGNSYAYGISGDHQVGYGRTSP